MNPAAKLDAHLSDDAKAVLFEKARAGDGPGLAEALAALPGCAFPRLQEHGDTLLMAAASADSSDCLEVLLPFFDPDQLVKDRPGIHGECALDRAYRAGALRSIAFLEPITSKAIEGRSPMTKFMLAAGGPNVPWALSLITPESARESTPYGATALMIASSVKNFEVVKALLPLSDPSAVTGRGMTALHQAARQGNHRAVHALVGWCDPLARDDYGATPLMLAMGSLCQKSCAALLPASDLDARDLAGFCTRDYVILAQGAPGRPIENSRPLLEMLGAFDEAKILRESIEASSATRRPARI